MPPDGPEPSGLDDALFGADTAPNPIVRLPGTTDRGDALDDALFGTDVSAAGPTGVRADDDAERRRRALRHRSRPASPAPGGRRRMGRRRGGAGPAADTSLFDDAPGGVGAGATVRRAPIDGCAAPRVPGRVVAAVAALLVLGLGGRGVRGAGDAATTVRGSPR